MIGVASYLIVGQTSANELLDDGNDLFDLDISQLMDIKVTTTNKREESHLQTPAMLTIISAREIDLLGFTSTEQVIEYLTGMSSVNGEGNVFTTTTILGNTLVNYNTNTLLLFDGKSLISPYHGSFDFSAIPISSIDRIEIVKGANSVLYGTNAINAVINVISKTANGNESPVGSVVGYIGQNNLNSMQFDYTDQEIGIYADLSNTGGEELDLLDESGNQATINPNKNLGSANIQYRIGEAHFSAMYFSRQQDNYRTKGFTDFQTNLETGWLVSGDYNFAIKDNQAVTFSIQQYQWNLDKGFTRFSDSNQYDWNYEGERTTVEVEYDLALENHNLIAGTQWSKSKGRRFKENSDAFDIGRYNQPTTDLSIYANGDSKLSESTRLYYGVRYFESSFKDESQNKMVEFDNLSFRGALVHQLNPTRSLKLISAQAFRVPTYFEKQVSSATVQGNANLEAEESQSNIFVFSQLFTFGVLDLSVYQTEIENKITRVPTLADPNIFENSNVGRIAFSGAEANFNFDYQDQLYGFAGISYNQNDDKDFENYFEWMVSGALSYRLTSSQSLGLSAKYLSDWGEAGSYLLVNPHYRYLITEEVELRVGVNNITNAEKTLPEIGRNKDSVPTIPVAHEANAYLRLKVAF